MKKLLLATALCAASFGFQTNAFAIMVYDPAAVGQIMKQVQQGTQQLGKLQEQIQQGAQQLEQLKSQLDQAKQLYNSLNVKPDISGLKDMFNKQGSSGALPSDFNHFQQSMGSGGGGGGGGGGSKNTQKWQEELKYKEPSGGAGSKEAVDAFYAQEVKKAEQRVVGQAAKGQDVYEEASETQKNITKLLDELGSTKDAGKIQGIQAKLAAVQADLQTKILQMQAAAMIQQAEYKAAEQRAYEEFAARYADYAKKLRGQ
ncbi:type IV secretion system protein [Bartonella grahamii]|uniref:P-type DNA transfer protein VirB5 n=1 Tax=Bartonella grahamii TaxID=33045 RepID=A0A336NB10_BARGR|nr:type IV secretion system protein [Bartonella grahamii]SSZ39486.1 P-type DNA transfer protein VirB5 [Bartonella grahamii]